MRCAERTGTCLMLWQHEFYMVMEARHGAYLYQALEFQVGTNLPPVEVEGWTQKQKKEVWVRGVAYAPALHVRKFNKVEQRKGYLFHSQFNDGDGDTALFGQCPEVVRVDNCMAWRPMSSVLETIPRVVHPSDIKTRVIHVVGREWHYVCGVAATEKDGTFTFKKIPRKHFYMYPEEALGPCVQSATIMWEHIERLFCNVRQLMQKSGGARSGSFSIPWTAACMSFFQVKCNRYFVVVACCKLILLFSAMKIGHDET